MIATLVPFLLVVGALTGYSLLLLIVFAGRAYRNGYAAGLCDAETLSTPSNVRLLLPQQRGGAA